MLKWTGSNGDAEGHFKKLSSGQATAAPATLTAPAQAAAPAKATAPVKKAAPAKKEPSKI